MTAYSILNFSWSGVRLSHFSFSLWLRTLQTMLFLFGFCFLLTLCMKGNIFMKKSITKMWWNTTVYGMLLLLRHSVISDFLWPHGLQHTRLPCPSLSRGACSNSCPLSWWRHPTIRPLYPPSPPSFNLSQHQCLFQWVSSSHQMTKVLELQHQSFRWITRTDFL